MKQLANVTGYIAAFLLVATVIFKINYLQGGGIIMIISGAFLSIYFPVYIVNRLADTNGGKSLTMHYFLALSVALINLAVVFKIQHWAGPGPFLIAGFGTLAFLYLPALLMHKLKQNPPANFRIIYIVGFVGAFLLLVGLGLKVLHWPASMGLMFIGAILLFVIFFPLYMFNFSGNKEDTYIYLRDVFFAIIIGGILSIFIVREIFTGASANPAPVAEVTNTM
jgi:hypothetical protein